MVSTDTQYSNVDLGAVESWVRLIHGDSEGFVHICSTLSWSGAVFHVATDMEKLKRYVQQLHTNGAKGIYMRATTIGRPLAPGERGSVEDSVSLPGFWADIDIAGPGHKTNKPLPPTVEDGMRIIEEARLPQPTLWVHSGGGLYPWWLFNDTILMVHAEIVDSMQDLSNRWQACIVAAAERLGYSYGSVGDLSRVLRVPGTLNRKVDGAAPMCRILFDGGPRLADDEIEMGLAEAEEYMASVTPQPGKVETIKVPIPRSGEDSGDRPGDALAAAMEWSDILAPHGYQFDRQQGEEGYWVRPGKNRRDGHSCTTNYQGSDLLYVFSDAMDGFEINRTYSKFAAWAILNGHGSDFKAAAKDLRSRGFGSQRPQRPSLQPAPLQPAPLPEEQEAEVPVDQPVPVFVPRHYDNSDIGCAERLVDRFGRQFRWVGGQREWYAWGDGIWEVDQNRRIDRAAKAITQDILDEAAEIIKSDDEHAEVVASGSAAKLRKCQCAGCTLRKFGTASRSDNKIKAMISRFGGEEGIAAAVTDFDRNKKLVTVGNGVLNPETRALYDFDSRRMLTKKMGANYDPDATAPEFEAFLEQVLPDPAMRDYVQRAMGYTLLGENDQRAIFMIKGPSGTGKSQFLNIFEGLFGTFGTTAAAATFRHTRNEATNDLHALRGKRFVTTSETSETSVMDEELIKRITGRDNVTSRDLYEKNSTWTPECAIWLATNFSPKFNTDDPAIWARFKPIVFDQQFSREEGTEIPDLGKKILAKEASGILNWVLEGVRKYRERGLGQPETVTEEVNRERLESDNVAQFLDSMIEDGRLEERQGRTISRATLYDLYENWCQKDRQHPLGQRRFTRRLRALRNYGDTKSNGVRAWDGIGLTGQAGFLGTMG